MELPMFAFGYYLRSFKRQKFKRKAACLKWLVTSDFPNIIYVTMLNTGTLSV
jgi:hypothetical protein